MKLSETLKLRIDVPTKNRLQMDAKAAGRDQVLVFLQRPRGAGGFVAVKIKK